MDKQNNTYFIAVDCGPFDTIQEAAYGELETDWGERGSLRARACTECYGAVDLKKHLERLAPHASFHLQSRIPETGNGIAVGRLAAERLRLLSNPPAELAEGEFAIETVVREGQTLNLLAADTGQASLYAASAYLEALGIRWYSPSPDGTCCCRPPAPFTLPILSLRESPGFKTRACYSELVDDSDEAFLDWMMHNRLNFVYFEQYRHPERLKKRGIQICMGGHNMLSRYLPPAKYYARHPDWFGLVDGKRSDNVGEGGVEGFGDNFCTSNEEAVTELCNNIINALAGGALAWADYLNFWMLDNGTWCQCDACREAGNPSSRLCTVVYRLNKAIKDARKAGILNRDIKILFPAYHETLDIPSRELPEDFDYENCIATYFPIERCYVHNLDDPCCTETNRALFQRLCSWALAPGRTYRGQLAVGEYYNVGAFAAASVSFTSRMAHDIPLYHRLGVRHMYYMHMTARDWGTLTPTNYLFYSLLWNPDADAAGLMEEFYSFYYRECAKEMKDFYTCLETASANMKYFKHYQYLFSEDGEHRLSLSAALNRSVSLCGTGEGEDLFPLKHFQYDTRFHDENAGISMVETMAYYEQCRVLLDQSVLKAREESTLRRLLEDDMRFCYTLDMLTYLYHMTRLCLFHREGNTLAAAREYRLAARTAHILKTTVKPLEGLMHFAFFRDGLSATWAEQAFVEYSRIYSSCGPSAD